jgi:hypothetical protein
MYIPQLLLKVVTAGIVALVISGNKLLYACAKEVYRLCAQTRFDIFHQILINADKHCHGGALHRMSAFHAFCSERPYAAFLVFCNTLLMLFWSLVA